jgi:nitronate monooxygenase
MAAIDTPLTRDAGTDVPLICGPMYPCSNSELVAAASHAGALGVLQPVTLTYVFGQDFREGIQKIRSLTDRPIGMNALIEASSETYLKRISPWIDIALEEGVRFFITSLGKPQWVVDRVSQVGGVVYHDVTERKWAQKAVDSGVQGLIAVNKRAGGHAGPLSAEAVLDDVGDLGLPVVCAGGIATGTEFAEVLRMGYAGVQMGTRFIATEECQASAPYKQAIVDSKERDIVLTERLTGVPVAVINTPYVQRLGLHAGPIARRMLKGRKTKHLMRSLFWLSSARTLKRTALDSTGSTEYWQAGRSVARIDSIVSAASIVQECADAVRADQAAPE